MFLYRKRDNFVLYYIFESIWQAKKTAKYSRRFVRLDECIGWVMMVIIGNVIIAHSTNENLVRMLSILIL